MTFFAVERGDVSSLLGVELFAMGVAAMAFRALAREDWYRVEACTRKLDLDGEPLIFFLDPAVVLRPLFLCKDSSKLLT